MVRSLLDTDLYKFTMAQCVFDYYKDEVVMYKFHNRGERLNVSDSFIRNLEKEIEIIKELTLSPEELEYLESLGIFSSEFLTYLENTLDLSETEITITNNNDLEITLGGPWLSAIFWEVPLMATISELYYKYKGIEFNKAEISKLIFNKVKALDLLDLNLTEFGTRRRFSFEYQDLLLSCMSSEAFNNCFATSNLYFAKKYDLEVRGTQAHELYSFMEIKYGPHIGTAKTIDMWEDVYGYKDPSMLIALPDTFTTDLFLKVFSTKKAKLWSGFRQDSGDPLIFANRILNFYKNHGVDVGKKKILFSDGISDISTIIKIQDYCDDNGIPCGFGIGTWLTNDVPGVKPLNIVIKLNGAFNLKEVSESAIKLSDVEGKYTGDREKIEKVKKGLGMI